MANKGKPKFPTFFKNQKYYKKCKNSLKLRKNGLEQVQLSPIWMKLCMRKAECLKKVLTKPEGHQQSNKEVNEEFFSK